MATYPQQRPHAVQVTETVDYTGWVLAVDPDDADDQAHQLLVEGNQNPCIGHLDVIRRDVEVMANDARDTCWRCRTDPNTPNPICPHPAPHSSTAGRTANAGTPALNFDPLGATRWLRASHREHPGTTNAAVLGVDEEHFGCRTDGFLNTIDDLLAADPAGLVRRADVQAVQMWRIDDGDVPDRGAVITVDLANGVRLATTYQDIDKLRRP